MSERHPIVAITGSSGAGTSTVQRTFEEIFRRENVTAAVIEGEVENSILFRGVMVRPGAVVKNCVVMQDSVIQRHAQIENVILDKQVNVQENSRLISSPSYPLVVPKDMSI